MKCFPTGFTACLLLAACGGGDNDPAPPMGGSNTAPDFTSAATASVSENTSDSFYMAAASDAEGDALSFTIAGGADAALFSITMGGALSFETAPDFEAPADGDNDNIYELTLEVSDGEATASRAITVTVTDVLENISVRQITESASAPLTLAGRASGDLLVGERAGRIRILDPDTGVFNSAPFLDISTIVGTAGEGGLLGLALAPDYASSGAFYVHITNLSGDTEIRRYQRSPGDPDVADPASGDIILTVNQPASNHNGGWIGFGPDGFLYIGLGDGGGGGDPDGNAQNVNTLLGAMLRIDPSSDDFPGDADRDYAIPAGNPFAGGGGAPEIYAYGLRNPYRSSFDRDTGDLYIGDVGQGDIEEVDLIPPNIAGLNFGWPAREGTTMEQGPDSPDFTPPIAEYGHGSGPLQGNSITGGVVYRGPVTELQGEYVFADFISNNIWSFPVASVAQGTTLSSSAFTVLTDALTPDAGSLESIVGFGEDIDENLYILTIGGSIFVLETP
ncbi:PQQ-dependent sugar dehydrogenase [Hyphococcus luteus]|nr:PQQ-dependent sugar dehydrogenase [Marinicaulis flavus]